MTTSCLIEKIGYHTPIGERDARLLAAMEETQESHRARAMGLAGARLHHAEEALRIADLAEQGVFAERCGRRRLRVCTNHLNRTLIIEQREHAAALSRDELTLRAHAFTVQGLGAILDAKLGA